MTLGIKNENGTWEPLLVDGHPQLLDPQKAQGFFEQVGRNTGYIIHPDEILAENFVLMLNGEANVPSPGIIEGMRSLLRRHDRIDGTLLPNPNASGVRAFLFPIQAKLAIGISDPVSEFRIRTSRLARDRVAASQSCRAVSAVLRFLRQS